MAILTPGDLWRAMLAHGEPMLPREIKAKFTEDPRMLQYLRDNDWVVKTGENSEGSGYFQAVDPLPTGQRGRKQWLLAVTKYYSTLPGESPPFAVIALAGVLSQLAYSKTMEVKFHPSESGGYRGNRTPSLAEQTGLEPRRIRPRVNRIQQDGWLVPLDTDKPKGKRAFRLAHRGPV